MRYTVSGRAPSLITAALALLLALAVQLLTTDPIEAHAGQAAPVHASANA